MFTPAKTRSYEDLIRCEALSAMGNREPLEGPISLRMTAYVPIPASIKGARRLDALAGILKPVTRPDLDNYLKAAQDACNGILFRDDNQITDLIARKRYSDRPRLTITIEGGPEDAFDVRDARPIGEIIKPIIERMEVA